MRQALLSDIHGNLVSFKAVLKEIEASSLDRILYLGDAVAFGPQPREIIAALKTVPADFIMGNTDAMMLNPPYATEFESKKEQIHYERIRWCREQLSESDLEFIRGFKPTMEILLADGLTLLAYHGSTLADNESIFADTPSENLDRILQGQRAALFAGGHTHIQMLRRYKDRIFINPGSVGRSIVRVGGHDFVPPWAEYAMINADSHGFSIEMHRLQINVEEVIASARQSTLPYAKEWIAEWKT
jgi:predicted phosphodiesterase